MRRGVALQGRRGSRETCTKCCGDALCQRRIDAQEYEQRKALLDRDAGKSVEPASDLTCCMRWTSLHIFLWAGLGVAAVARRWPVSTSQAHRRHAHGTARHRTPDTHRPLGTAGRRHMGGTPGATHSRRRAPSLGCRPRCKPGRTLCTVSCTAPSSPPSSPWSPGFDGHGCFAAGRLVVAHRDRRLQCIFERGTTLRRCSIRSPIAIRWHRLAYVVVHGAELRPLGIAGLWLWRSARKDNPREHMGFVARRRRWALLADAANVRASN